MVEAFREGQQREIPRHTEGELPEVKIYDLLSSVGNGEHHALDLIVMEKGVIYSKYDHYKKIMSHQERDRGWKTNRNLSFKHCQNSLAPIGLVTREALSSDGTVWGHEITEYGLHTGVPFAGALLKWSYEHPKLSLYKMSGSTQSSSIKDEQTLDKKRAQETRYKIFWEIATNPSNRIRLTDIANGINENVGLTKNHLLSLRQNGIVSYESAEEGKSHSYFKRKEIVPDEEQKPYKHDKTLSTRLLNLLTQRFIQIPTEYLSTEEIANTLIQEYPEYEGRRLNTRIAATLTDFEKQGYVEREKFSSDFKSEIKLSDERRESIVSFVTLLDSFKNGDKEILEEGRRFAQRVLNEPQLFSQLMLKAKEASPFANQTNREVTQSFLISILYDHPNSTAKQIQQFLGENYDKELARRAIGDHLLALFREGKIISEKTKSGNVYRVVENPDIQAAPPQN